MKPEYVGIDYGKQKAGTTAIAFISPSGDLQLTSTEKNQDADRFIKNQLAHSSIQEAFIDAPLTLPAAYYRNDHSDFFFRQCDRAISGMSPMFLGGLTARAIRLKSELKALNIRLMEAYPSKMATILGLRDIGYKKQKSYLRDVEEAIKSNHQLTIKDSLNSWHEVDAVLTALIHMRYAKNQHQTFGQAEEGLVYV